MVGRISNEPPKESRTLYLKKKLNGDYILLTSWFYNNKISNVALFLDLRYNWLWIFEARILSNF